MTGQTLGRDAGRWQQWLHTHETPYAGAIPYEPGAREAVAMWRQLASGEPFAIAAESLGFANGGKWREISVDQLADLVITIRDAIEKLKVGDTAGPIFLGHNVLWFHVADQVQPPAQPYEAVREQLRRELRSRRWRSWWAQYFQGRTDHDAA